MVKRHPDTAELFELLRALYSKQMKENRGEAYLEHHADPAFCMGAVRTFNFYRSYLPEAGAVLDWGCRHAPDSCLIRSRASSALTICGCDVEVPNRYQVFFEYAHLQYSRLDHHYLLPYPDNQFDAVIASGVLEHVPMGYESLKELYRVLRPNGRLIITYLPNSTSVEEFLLRRNNGAFHKHLYTPQSLRNLLAHTGFQPLVVGYQTMLELLAADGPAERLVRAVCAPTGLKRLTSCLAAVAEKAISF